MEVVFDDGRIHNVTCPHCFWDDFCVVYQVSGRKREVCERMTVREGTLPVIIHPDPYVYFEYLTREGYEPTYECGQCKWSWTSKDFLELIQKWSVPVS